MSNIVGTLHASSYAIDILKRWSRSKFTGQLNALLVLSFVAKNFNDLKVY